MNTRCVNPFEKENHKVTKGLVNVPKNISEKYPSIPEYSKICVACKLDFTKQKAPTNAKKFLEQIKEKFSSSEDKRGRILLLTLAPQFWSRNDLVKEFGCTEWEARRAKGLVSDRGILSWPDKKRGKTLSPDVVDAVKAYYNRDDNSWLMSGMNDYISVKNSDGEREHVQERLLLCNINELYSQFVQEYPDKKIGITKFTQLRPKHCVIAGSSGTHVVSVCVHHENVELMLDSINIGITKIFHVTDGASQHFKNKSNFANLVAHEKDFGVVAEWHFHATAHGKGACDGIGAKLKRGAKQASLQCSSQYHILTPQSLFEWAKKYCKETEVFFSGKEVYEQVKDELKMRFDMHTDPIPGTLQSHAFIPTSDGLLMFKKYSLASEHIFPKKKRAPKQASQITKRRKTPAKKNSQTKPKTAKHPQIKQKPVKRLPIEKVGKKSKAKR
ncbi:hypothetical protein QAD02_012606 [Eretmocerus hayati]|uniref:Uncharacterized protein n=1 Tax=Eretmocerus hayati TaxID=131215 RepID=A0ACC2P2Q9_9HYME|nr:hypothetical protein QAD02_012606 [Eretmocerus hayati]